MIWSPEDRPREYRARLILWKKWVDYYWYWFLCDVVVEQELIFKITTDYQWCLYTKKIQSMCLPWCTELITLVPLQKRRSWRRWCATISYLKHAWIQSSHLSIGTYPSQHSLIVHQTLVAFDHLSARASTMVMASNSYIVCWCGGER